jgi:DNA-binding CsgD family transcriptional regulator
MLQGTAREQTTHEQQARRSAEIALYAAAAGMLNEADTELQQASSAVDRSAPAAKDTVYARLFIALAELIRGHDAAAHRHVAEAERSVGSSMPRLQSVAHAVRAMYRVRLGQADQQAVNVALERLRSQHFGGIARLLAVLPLGATETGYGGLTPAEREILQMLAKGASTKEVAGRTGRSPHTVDTHIRSICRKLSCRGRREAVALATSQGWVQT